ncbi:hypothetical protein [Burkholderia ubonensis]|nr:hypothetical protein [Burkholderia ubonensis]
MTSAARALYCSKNPIRALYRSAVLNGVAAGRPGHDPASKAFG